MSWKCESVLYGCNKFKIIPILNLLNLTLKIFSGHLVEESVYISWSVSEGGADKNKSIYQRGMLVSVFPTNESLTCTYTANSKKVVLCKP
jgi:hypothetical protein